jgi:hypothetical protein
MTREFLTPLDLKTELLLSGSAGTSGQQVTSQGPGLPPVWGAPGSGGGGLPSPGVAPWSGGSGSIIAPNSCSGTLSTANAQASTIYFHQIFIPETITVTQLICRTSSTYSGTNDVLLGIYANTQSRPTTKIVEASLQITASGAATYAVAISQSLSTGWYWLAFLSTLNGTPNFAANTASAAGISGGMFGEYTNAGAPISFVQQTGTSVLPATVGTVTGVSGNRPVCFLGV